MLYLNRFSKRRRSFFLIISALVGLSSPVYATSTVLATSGHPFQAVPIDGGLLVSVSANGKPGSTTGLRVFSGSSPERLGMKCLQPIDAPYAFGIALTPNGKGIVVAGGDAGLLLLSRSLTIDGCRSPVVRVSAGRSGSRQGSIDVIISHDGRFAFVSNEFGVATRDSRGRDVAGHVAVVSLLYNARGEPIDGKVIRRIATGGSSVAGLTLSPDGSRLYVASETAEPGARVGNLGVRKLTRTDCREGAGPARPFGLLSVIDVAKAEQSVGNAMISADAAGCSPVRTIVSPDGLTVWVTARGEDKVLAFSTAMMETDPAHAFLGEKASGGRAPVGLAFYAHGTGLAVANSNRFAGSDASGNLALFDFVSITTPASRTIAAGHFPRSLTTSNDGSTLFLTDFNGGRVEVVVP